MSRKRPAGKKKKQQRQSGQTASKRWLAGKRWKVATAIVLLLAATALALSFDWNRLPPPALVIPDQLDQLEPQAKAHISDFLQHAGSAPHDAPKRAQLGLVLAANGLWPEAYETFAQAVELDSQQQMAHYYMGVALREMGDVTGALHRFREVGSQFPDFAPAHHSLGEALLEEGRTQEAKAAFDETIRLASSQPHGFVGLADALLREHDYEGANAVLEKTLARHPHQARARYLLGLAYRGLGRRAEAQQYLKSGMAARKEFMPDPWTRELRQHDKSVQGQIRLAVSYARAGQSRQTGKILEEALQWNAQHTDVLNNLATVHLSLGEPRKALAYGERASSIDENRAEFAITLALCHEALDDPHEALRHANRAVVLAPNSSRAFSIKAQMHGHLKKYDEVLANLQEAARLDPGNTTLVNEIGIVLMRLARFPKAEQQLRTAIQLEPNNITAYLNLATVYLQMKQSDKAQAVLRAANERAPHDARISQFIDKLGNVKAEDKQGMDEGRDERRRPGNER